MQSLDTFIWVVIGLAIVVVILFCWLLYLSFYVKSMRASFNDITENMDGIADVLTKFKGEVKRWDYISKVIADSESSQTNIQLSIGDLNRRFSELEQKIDDVQMQEPESKMYNRAVKMVKSGASLKEIMEECELPQPEAELLISIHRPNGSGSSSPKKQLHEL